MALTTIGVFCKAWDHEHGIKQKTVSRSGSGEIRILSPGGSYRSEPAIALAKGRFAHWMIGTLPGLGGLGTKINCLWRSF